MASGAVAAQPGRAGLERIDIRAPENPTGNPVQSNRATGCSGGKCSQCGGEAAVSGNSDMTEHNGPRQVRNPGADIRHAKAMMVPATESAWSGSSMVAKADTARTSRKRLLEARGDLVYAEQEYVNHSSEVESAMLREADELRRKAVQVQAEAWAIEQEALTRAKVLQDQAQMEGQLADRIREIAERSALAVLDRIKEASDSMMDWAGLMGEDLSELLKKEAGEQVSRKIADIQAVEEAMEDEARALELLELAAQYKKAA